MALSQRQRKGAVWVKDNIIPVSDATPYVRALLYGKNGKGKTRIAATAPKPLLLDINEEGTTSIRHFDGVKVLPIKTWEQLDWAYWYLREAKHGFESVILDTLTQAAKLCMNQVLDLAEDRDPNRPPKTPAQRDWGAVTQMMKEPIFNFRNLPMNVIFVCQERVDRGANSDEDEGGEIRPRVVPDLSPAIRGDALAAVDITGRVYRRGRRVGRGKKERLIWETRMLVGDDEMYETKDRTYQLGRIVREPTVPMMLEAKHRHEQEEE